VDLVLVTRQDCHLCDDALAFLGELGAAPRLADVDADPRLHDLYDWRVPVVLLDGRVIAEGRINPDQLARQLGLENRRGGTE
jgi:predicted thioredoxin/glutaredoxin